jgi:putative transposase
MRNLIFSEGEHYHLYNRGNEKQTLFHDKGDHVRFLYALLHAQTPSPLSNVSYAVNVFEKIGKFSNLNRISSKSVTTRDVHVVAFCIMPNHFHIIASEQQEGGLSRYAHQILTAYAMYFNTKYKHSGHVFQGPFGATHITSNEQMLYTSAYVHRNPREVESWKGREHKFPWSSYQDYVAENRWGESLALDVIFKQFDDGESYRHFVDESGAKDLDIDLE